MKKKRVGKVIKICIIAVVLVAIAGGVFWYIQTQNAAALQASTPNYIFASVEEGDVNLGVTASGSVSSQNTTNIVLDWSGKVKTVNYELGDTINEGDVLAIVENEDLKDSVSSAQNALSQQQIALEKQTDALSKNIVAPSTGRIKMIKAKVGEEAATTAATYGQIAWISPDAAMMLTCTTNYVMDVDQILEVADKQGMRYKAKVTASSGKTTTIEIEDDTYLNPGDRVKVYYRNEVDSQGEGDVTIKNGVKVTGTGKIKEVLVEDNQTVSRGDNLFVLDTKDATLNYQSQSISVSDAQKKVSTLRKDLGKSDLPSPVAGVISALNLVEGSSAADGQIVAAVQDIENLQTVIQVDELDIAKVKVGQKVSITLEALEDKIFTGTVTKIATIGQTSNNFATYPVTVSLDEHTDIKIGMSCEATIEVDVAKNVVRIPVEYLQNSMNGYTVIVKKNQDASATTTPDAATSAETKPGANIRSQATTEVRKVEVGLINDAFAEIVSGLSAGEEVGMTFVITNPFAMQGAMGGNATRVETGSGPERTERNAE